jgi:hypothetical protein
MVVAVAVISKQFFWLKLRASIHSHQCQHHKVGVECTAPKLARVAWQCQHCWAGLMGLRAWQHNTTNVASATCCWVLLIRQCVCPAGACDAADMLLPGVQPPLPRGVPEALGGHLLPRVSLLHVQQQYKHQQVCCVRHQCQPVDLPDLRTCWLWPLQGGEMHPPAASSCMMPPGNCISWHVSAMLVTDNNTLQRCRLVAGFSLMD